MLWESPPPPKKGGKRHLGLIHTLRAGNWEITTQHRYQRKGLIPSTKTRPICETRLDKFFPFVKGSSKKVLLTSKALNRNK